MSQTFFKDYAARLTSVIAEAGWCGVESLAADLLTVWHANRQVFICGNGGSAGNAIHLANDLIYGVAMPDGNGISAYALSANPAVVTCLANDIGYERIFAAQLSVHASPGDILIALSGSGNSPNILAVLEEARRRSVKSYAVLGYSGGKAKDLADVAIHFPINDMQIAEDLQLVVGHMLMQWLHANRIHPNKSR